MVINRVSRIVRKISSSSVIRNSFVYVLCDGVNKAIPFLLLPFITHYLSPADYGIVTNYNVLVQIVSVFAYVSTAEAIPVMFAKLDRCEIKKYISNMILLNTIANIICVVFMLFFTKNIFNNKEVLTDFVKEYYFYLDQIVYKWDDANSLECILMK